MIEDKKQIDYMARMLCPDYPEGCGHCRLSDPESEYSCTIEEDCKNLVESGFRMERYSCWVFDEYEECMVCNSCIGKALPDPNAPDKVMLTDYCPHCGAKMNTNFNTTEKTAKWEFWSGWVGNHDRRIEDATCSNCGYVHPTIRREIVNNKFKPNETTQDILNKLSDTCPGCGAKMKGSAK
jgi:hypothetical protein